MIIIGMSYFEPLPEGNQQREKTLYEMKSGLEHDKFLLDQEYKKHTPPPPLKVVDLYSLKSKNQKNLQRLHEKEKEKYIYQDLVDVSKQKVKNQSMYDNTYKKFLSKHKYDLNTKKQLIRTNEDLLQRKKNQVHFLLFTVYYFIIVFFTILLYVYNFITTPLFYIILVVSLIILMGIYYSTSNIITNLGQRTEDISKDIVRNILPYAPIKHCPEKCKINHE